MRLVDTILLVVVWISVAALIAPGQARQAGIKTIESYLLDVPSAPYRLRASSNGRGYEFCNASKVRVMRFRLGCVETKGRELKVLSKRPVEDGGLAPADGNHLHGRLWEADHGFFPGEPCQKGKLAVVEVELGNRTVWRLKP